MAAERGPIAVATIPDTARELKLYRYPDRDVITILGRGELMSSRMHGSEETLASLGCAHLSKVAGPRVLVAGLGLGFTLAAALAEVREDAEVVVSELIPEVVEWNRTLVGHHAGHPLSDERVQVVIGDVADVLRAPGDGFDVVLMDVDNGPEGLIRRENDWLYGAAGLSAARRSLRTDGVLAVWSASGDDEFTHRLKAAGFQVEEHRVLARSPARKRRGRGTRHHIWLARRD